MPHLETWSRLPAAVRDHLIERMHDRKISVEDLNQLRRPSKRKLSIRHLMPVVHNSATEMAEDKPENCRENRLERWIHARKIN